MALALCIPALAQTGDSPNQEPLILTDEQGKYPLGLRMELLEDPSGELTIEEVSSPAFTSQFTPSKVTVPIFGFTKSVIWVRLRFNNQTFQTNYWLLEIGYPNTQYVDLYSPLPNGEGFSEKQSGVLRPPSTRDILFPRIIFRLAIPIQSQQTYYLRFQSGASMTLPLTLWAQSAFLNNALEETALLVLFYGILIGLLVYNIFLLISLREVSYLYLVLFLASFTFFLGSYDGFNEIYFIPNLYYLKPYYNPLSFVLAFVSVILFAESVLELKVRLPFFHRIMVIFLAGWVILVLLIPFTSYLVVARSMLFWALLLNILLLVAGSILWKKGFTPVRFFMIAWIGLLASLSVVFLVRFGSIPSTNFTENFFRLGLVWMAVWWSLTLADRINLLRAETEDANRNLRNSESRLSQILESLPLGVVVYGKDAQPNYTNQRAIEILSNPAKGIQAGISASRTLGQALEYFSFHKAGSDQKYPIENLPVYRALHGEIASEDDIEADLVDRRVPLEVWASPIKDDLGNVETAVAAFQDITSRKNAEAELNEYRHNLEKLVEQRTAELNAINDQLNQEVTERKFLEGMQYKRIEWLSAINRIHQTISSTADLPQAYQQLSLTIVQLMGAKSAFIGMWDEQSDQMDVLCYPQPDGLPSVGKRTSIHFQKDSDLSREIEQSELVIRTVDQTTPLPAPLEQCFQTEGLQTVILAPMMARQGLVGLLGMGIERPAQAITLEESDLIKRIAFDLGDLAEDARLFEKARALAVSEERNRLARDLHDSVTQVLFSASLVAETLPQIWRRDPEKGVHSLEELRRLTRGALAEMRTMLVELRPTALTKTPLGELLTQLTEATTSRTRLSFRLYIESIPILPEDVQASFYRIAQEGLNNIVKHAKAREVTVSLSATPSASASAGEWRGEVKLVILDDGRGFSPQNGSPERLGLGIMRERAAAIHAALDIGSQPGKGTQLILVWHNGKQEF